MKSKYLKIVLIIISIVFINIINLKPLYGNDCPTGYVEITKLVMVNINGSLCQYRVTMCVSCPAGTHPLPFTVRLYKFEPYPINCGFDPSEAKDAIISIIIDPDWITQNIGTDCFAGWGPCPENAVTVTGVTPLCWKKIKYKDDDNSIRVLYSGCYDEGCTCQQNKIICWNGTSFETTVSDYYREPSGCISPCENIPEPDNNTIPEPTLDNPFPESVCFGLNSPCTGK